LNLLKDPNTLVRFRLLNGFDIFYDVKFVLVNHVLEGDYLGERREILVLVNKSKVVDLSVNGG